MGWFTGCGGGDSTSRNELQKTRRQDSQENPTVNAQPKTSHTTIRYSCPNGAPPGGLVGNGRSVLEVGQRVGRPQASAAAARQQGQIMMVGLNQEMKIADKAIIHCRNHGFRSGITIQSTTFTVL